MKTSYGRFRRTIHLVAARQKPGAMTMMASQRSLSDELDFRHLALHLYPTLIEVERPFEQTAIAVRIGRARHTAEEKRDSINCEVGQGLEFGRVGTTVVIPVVPRAKLKIGPVGPVDCSESLRERGFWIWSETLNCDQRIQTSSDSVVVCCLPAVT